MCYDVRSARTATFFTYPSEEALMRTLRELREAAGLTQLELANRLGVTPGTIYNWERGRGEPRARQSLELALILNASPAAVLEAVKATVGEPGGAEGKAAA